MDTHYAGTVGVSTTDPLAALPSSFTFSPNDVGEKFLYGAVLRTVGVQTITVTDAANVLALDSIALTVTAPVAVPTISVGMKVLFAALLAITGLFLARLKP